MATATTNRWKLGLFVLSGILLGLGTIFWLGVRTAGRASFEAVTYFEESVQGLEVGAPIKFKGVRVGDVSDITVAPDHSTVQVTARIFMDVMVRLGLRDGSALRKDTPGRFVPEGVRVQIASTGITGTKFIDAQIVDPARHPPPKLTFETPWNYVPSMPSTFQDLENRAIDTLERLPVMLDETSALASDARMLLSSLQTKMDSLDIATIASQSQALLVEAHEAMQVVRRLATKFDADDGPLQRGIAQIGSTAKTIETEVSTARIGETTAAVRQMSKSVGGAADTTTKLEERMEIELEELHRALESAKALAAMLERDPEALLRGKSADSLPHGGR